ncbi:hypothetical protein LJR230_004122 [Trinickia sp. LjRoot230]|uniref:hypothetical protein n=1 Tax=Trinickia sp. LjRoot230 TaxID=3342288 RepID=UPI003ECE17ED
MIDRIGGGAGANQPERPDGVDGAAVTGSIDGSATQQSSNHNFGQLRADSAQPKNRAPTFAAGKDRATTGDILAEKANAVRTLDDVRTLLGRSTSMPSGPTIASVPFSQQIELLHTIGLHMGFIEPAADRTTVMREILNTTRDMPDTVDRGPVLSLLPLAIKDLDAKDQETAFRLLSKELNAAQRKNSIDAADYTVGFSGLIEAFEKMSPTFQRAHIGKLLGDIANLPPDLQAAALYVLGTEHFSLSDEIKPEVSRAIVLAWASDHFNNEHRGMICSGLVRGVGALRPRAAADAAVMTLLDAAEELPAMEQRMAFAYSLQPVMPIDETSQAYAALVQKFDKTFKTALNVTELPLRYQMLLGLAMELRNLSNVDATNCPLSNDRYTRYRQLCDAMSSFSASDIKANQTVPLYISKINETLDNARVDLLRPEENEAIEAFTAFMAGKDLATTGDILAEKANAVRTLDDVRALLGRSTSTSGPTIAGIPHSQQIELLHTIGLHMRFIEPAGDRIGVMREILNTTSGMPDSVDQGPVLKMLPHMIKELEPKDQDAAFKRLSRDLSDALRKESITAEDYCMGLGGLVLTFGKTSLEFQMAHVGNLFADIAKLPPHEKATLLHILGQQRFSLSDQIEPDVSRAIVLARASNRFNDQQRHMITQGLVLGIDTLPPGPARNAALATLLEAAESLPTQEQRMEFAKSLEPYMPSDGSESRYTASLREFDRRLQVALGVTDPPTRHQILKNLAAEIHTLSNVDGDQPLTNDRYRRYQQMANVLLPALVASRNANQPDPDHLLDLNQALHNARAFLSDEENAAVDAAIEAVGLRPETR